MTNETTVTTRTSEIRAGRVFDVPCAHEPRLIPAWSGDGTAVEAPLLRALVGR